MIRNKLILLLGLFSVVVILAACSKGGEVQTTATPLNNFSQDITAENAPGKINAGENFSLSVTVKNTSNETWVKSAKTYHVHPVLLWLDDSGKTVAAKSAYFPKNLGPDESISLQIPLSAPARKGKYVLRVTMVQEDVAYFDKKGAKPLDMTIIVN